MIFVFVIYLARAAERRAEIADRLGKKLHMRNYCPFHRGENWL